MRTPERLLPSGSGSKVPLPFDPESLAEKNKDFGLECMVFTYHRLYALFSLLFLSEKKKPIVLIPPGRWKASSALFHQLTAFLWLTTSTEMILFNWGAFSKILDYRQRKQQGGEGTPAAVGATSQVFRPGPSLGYAPLLVILIRFL